MRIKNIPHRFVVSALNGTPNSAKVVHLSYGKVGATSVLEYFVIGSIAFRL